MGFENAHMDRDFYFQKTCDIFQHQTGGGKKSYDLINNIYYLNTAVSQMQKCNILSDKLSHYLREKKE